VKAVAITPKVPDSDRLIDVDEPERQSGQCLVQVLSVGVDGTDSELVAGTYGEAPKGDDFLIIGHESLGRVLEGAGDIKQGQVVSAIVRRPDPVPCRNCAAGEWDMCLNGRYTERGIKGRHGFLTEMYTEAPEFLIPVPEDLGRFGVLAEPTSVVEKAVEQVDRIQTRLIWQPERALVLGGGTIGLLATAVLRLRGIETLTYNRSVTGPKPELVDAVGAKYVRATGDLRNDLAPLDERPIDIVIEATGVSKLAFDAIDVAGPNGIVCLTGVSSGSRRLEIAADHLNLEMVLENKVTFGSVNANRRHFENGVRDLQQIKSTWPGWLDRMITRTEKLDHYKAALERRDSDVKVVVEISDL
jgi:glucose 1-dehydrogenase